MENNVEKNMRTKTQIQLIKQKYLRKNINNPSNQQASASAQTISVQKSIPIIQKSATQKKLPLKQQQIKSEAKQTNVDKQMVVQQKGTQKWSLKTFIQQQYHVKDKKQKQTKQQQLQDIKFDEKDPFSLRTSFRFPLAVINKAEANDPQFQQIRPQQITKHQKQKKISHKASEQKDLSYAVVLWKQNIRKCLIYLCCQNQNIQSIDHKLELKSKNPSFPGIVKQLAQNFIFNNNQILKDSQKQVVYNMALQYFSPSPEHLSDVLLITIIKIMPNYAFIYCDQIIRQMSMYGQRIIRLKKYLLKQQLDNFIKCLQQRVQSLRIDGHKINTEVYIWILIIKPNSNICQQILLTRNIQSQKNLLMTFCALQPDGRQTTLSILYLKCMDLLTPLFIRTGILQKVISHLSELKVSQALYQPVKSLKLKLIKAADPKKDKKKVDEDKVFVNFLNQKVSKLKEILQSKVNSKPKSQVYYNKVSCHYQAPQITSNFKTST